MRKLDRRIGDFATPVGPNAKAPARRIVARVCDEDARATRVGTHDTKPMRLKQPVDAPAKRLLLMQRVCTLAEKELIQWTLQASGKMLRERSFESCGKRKLSFEIAHRAHVEDPIDHFRKLCLDGFIPHEFYL